MGRAVIRAAGRWWRPVDSRPGDGWEVLPRLRWVVVGIAVALVVLGLTIAMAVAGG
ncbi:hypothetical protein LO772_20990 [Yinghuangia sp. ASG 101]|uniref:hypothetical protein n=1 Tax=Yinghuangia sp. ASG 101 TaxID=2896848 RepID=UPI001E3E9AFB|nr:hypothetical protein [Yinghuangia sp. ASG 101]UGQ09411.1 hypothetical protein LO772_20990 [Yinghuangia sp. ASG 101]